MGRARTQTIESINSAKPTDSRLTAVSFIDSFINKSGWRSWKVVSKCECGTVTTTSIHHLKSGKTKSCGCLQKEKARLPKSIYKNNHSKLSNSYHCMMLMCYNPKHHSYSKYGGKGVTVCDEWKDNYQAFIDWALSNGWAIGLTLDKDIKGNGMLYGPETCTWVTQLENNEAASRSLKFVFNGELSALGKISRETGINHRLLYERIKRGRTLDEAIEMGAMPNVKNQIIKTVSTAKSINKKKTLITDVKVYSDGSKE